MAVECLQFQESQISVEDFGLVRINSYCGISERFPKNVRDLVILPVCDETTFCHIQNFLASVARQRYTKGIGIIVLINEPKNCESVDANTYEFSDENRSAIDLFRALDSQHPDKANILPNSLRAVYEELVSRPDIHIRYESVVSTYPNVHFGALRRQLIDMVHAYKPMGVSDTDIVVHFQDADSYLPKGFIRNLRRWFCEDPTRKVHLAHEQYVPGIQENHDKMPTDYTSQFLAYFDTDREYTVLQQARSALTGYFQANTPVCSATLDAVATVQNNPLFLGADVNEDRVLINALLGVSHDHINQVTHVIRKNRISYRVYGTDSQDLHRRVRLGEFTVKLRSLTERVCEIAKSHYGSELLLLNTVSGIAEALPTISQFQIDSSPLERYTRLLRSKIHDARVQRAATMIRSKLYTDIPQVAQELDYLFETDYLFPYRFILYSFRDSEVSIDTIPDLEIQRNFFSNLLFVIESEAPKEKRYIDVEYGAETIYERMYATVEQLIHTTLEEHSEFMRTWNKLFRIESVSNMVRYAAVMALSQCDSNDLLPSDVQYYVSMYETFLPDVVYQLKKQRASIKHMQPEDIHRLFPSICCSQEQMTRISFYKAVHELCLGRMIPTIDEYIDIILKK